MTANLMDTVKGMLSSDTISRAATQTGESPDGMRKAMNGAIPSIFAGLMQGASTPNGAARIFGALSERGASTEGLMNTAFGDRGSAVAGVLAKSSGVGSGAASHALSLALPLVMGVLGKYVLANRLSAGGLAQTLFGQKKALLDDPNTPPGLAGALGASSLSGLGGPSAEVAEPHVSTTQAPVTVGHEPARVTSRVHGVDVHRKRSPWAFLIPALLLGALLIWGISSLTRSHAPRVGVTAPQPTLRAPEVPSVAPPSEVPSAAPSIQAPAVGPVTLPGGKSLDVSPDSAEAQMAGALADSSTSLPRTFNFDHLNFDYASATVSASSTKTVDDLATVLQAYPSARIRVVGHTDSLGTPATNQTLSESRASAIKDALVAKGIAADRIETSGEAATSPAPGTAPPSASNRRAEVVLLSR
jgi:OmpA-OmpF porin, OOP family